MRNSRGLLSSLSNSYFQKRKKTAPMILSKYLLLYLHVVPILMQFLAFFFAGITCKCTTRT